MTAVRHQPERGPTFITHRANRTAKARLRNKHPAEGIGRVGSLPSGLGHLSLLAPERKAIAARLVARLSVLAGVTRRRGGARRRLMNDDTNHTTTGAPGDEQRPRAARDRDRDQDFTDRPLVHFVHFGDRTEVYEKIARRGRDISTRTLRTLRFKTWVPFTRGFFSPYSLPSLKTKCTKCTRGCLPYAVPEKSRTLRVLSRSVRSVRGAPGGVIHA
jgi:hypothetical protein